MEKRTLQNRLTTKSTSQVKSKLLVLAFKLTWKSGQKEQEKLDKDEHFSSWERQHNVTKALAVGSLCHIKDVY